MMDKFSMVNRLIIIPYKQNHGPFTPFVSALDLVANCGKDGIEVMVSETKAWRDFLV